MKKIILPAVLAAGLVSAPASAIDVVDMITPTPVAIVVQIGKWMHKDQVPVYTVVVKSTGKTEEQARSEAFKLAVDEAIGSVVISETQVINGNLDRHEVVNYSSGYVEDFEVLNKKTDPAGVQLTVRVQVRGSDIANRVYNKSESDVDLAGDKILQSLKSLRHEQETGDQLLSAVMADYPVRAYDVDIQNIEYVNTNDRSTEMSVQFYLHWNNDYVNSMHETVKTVGHQSALQPSFRIKAAPGAAGWTRSWHFDRVRWRILYDNIVASRPAVKVTLLDTINQVVHSGCYFYTELDLQSDYVIPSQSMFYVNNDILQVNTYNVINASLSITVDESALSKLSKMNIKVVRKQNCK